MRSVDIGILPALLAGTLTLCAPAAAPQTAGSAAGDGAAAEVMDERSGRYSLRALLGVEVMSPQGETLGELHDVLYASGTERLVAVVSVGGVLGLGEKLISEPFSSIDISGEDRVVMNATPAELERRPAFDYAALGKPFAASKEDPMRREYLDAWTMRMERWSERMDVRTQAPDEVGRARLDAAWDEARRRWRALEETTEENWDRAAEAFETAFAAFKDAWDASQGE